MTLLILLACAKNDLSSPGRPPTDTVQPDTATPAYDPTEDHALLTDGLEQLRLGEAIPSAIVVHGPQAFPVVMAGGMPVVAAGRYGEGRVVVVGHEGLLEAILPGAIAWSGAASVGAAPGTSVSADTVRRLDGLDLYVTTTYDDLSAEEAASLADWVAAGGTLVAGGHAWWWGSENNRSDAAEGYAFNQVLAEMGLIISVESGPSGTLTVTTPDFELDHSLFALGALEAHEAGVRSLSLDEQVQGVNAAALAVTHVPLGWAWFEEAWDFLQALPEVIPSAADPVIPDEEPVDHLVVRVGAKFAAEAPVEELKANPAAVDFPGSGHSPVGTVTQTLSLSYAGLEHFYAAAGAAKDAWIATDLWVPAGELVTLSFARDVTGLGVQVGAHTDTLWHLDSWTRSPQITRTWPIQGDRITVGSAFGGLLYVTVPEGTDLGLVDVTIEGAASGPWVEHRGEWFALVVPTDTPVDDPAALMAWWDRVLEVEHSLAGYPDWPRLERAVFDRQISAGWMHSGYPFMAHLESASDMTDLTALQDSGDWGAFHELGHNHQDVAWMLPGTWEANVNLFSIYVMETVVGIDRSEAHPNMTDSRRTERIAAYVADGTFSDWSVWTALETYLQLQEAFGWAHVTDLMATYRTATDRPSTEREIIHQWMVRSSRSVGADLTDFYAAWKFPYTEDAAAELTDLPDWTDHPMAK